jgi:hypothetical protein
LLLVALAASGCATPEHNAVSPPPVTNTPSTSAPALPPAADGSNLAACEDGECEVLVTAPVEFTIRDIQTSVTIRNGQVRIRQSDGQGSTSQITVSGSGGTSSIGTADGQLTIRIKGVSGNKVVLDISSS